MSGAFQVQIYTHPGADRFNWRLLSGNNRSAGLGVVGHDTETACRSALRDLQRGTTGLRHRMRPTAVNRWVWELLDGDGGGAVAVGGHAFDRVGRCEHALARFLIHFASAPVSSTVLDSGSRRWVSPTRLLRSDGMGPLGNSSRVHASTVSTTPQAALDVPAWRPTVRTRLTAPTPDGTSP